MTSLASAGFVVFILVLFAGIYLSLFGLPGAILIFLDVLTYSITTGFAHVGWKSLLFLLFLALLAESVDVLLGMTRAYKPPVNKKSIRAAAIGAVAGMVIFTPLLWGPGTWTGFFLGGMAGLIITELFRLSKIKGPPPATNLSFMAMIGKKSLKGILSLVMIFVSLDSIYS